MKTAAFGLALMLSGAAFAQVEIVAESQAYEGDGAFTNVFETEGSSGGAYVDPTLTATELAGLGSAGAAGRLVAPGNSDPERDARGIAVISAAAIVPAGWNGTAAGAATGGPELDPATGEAVAPSGYPACTATVTDRCVQTYEVGRR